MTAPKYMTVVKNFIGGHWRPLAPLVTGDGQTTMERKRGEREAGEGTGREKGAVIEAEKSGVRGVLRAGSLRLSLAWPPGIHCG